MGEEKRSAHTVCDGTPDGVATMVRTIEHLIAALLDETVPAGDLRQIIKSVRQSILECDPDLHSSPGISALARELTVELLFGKGMWERNVATAELDDDSEG